MNLIVFKLVSTIVTALIVSALAACNRKPQGATGDRSPVDDNFQIHMEGNPASYIPGQQYNMSLSCASDLKFISFTLVVECDNCHGSAYDMLGHFKIIDFAETRFSTLCENMIESTNANTKSRVDIAWVAPTNPDSGCIFIRAAVLQHRNVWFIDDGFLSKRICPEEIDEVNSQIQPVNPCCACDEGKYEIVLERRWSRNTHAKDYPREYWRTRLSELVGASHTFDYRFWEYGSRASKGLQELAEHGSTNTLESEIKENSNMARIRTIVKASGIPHRHNVMGTTLASVRVDPKHHVISLVTKIDPSPDWILGVSGLELCLLNCTWIERKMLNLYPWDVGTDAGPSYMSPDQPQIPPDVIRRITSTFPSDHRSPFYDDSGAPMKPLATLFVVRRKLYERECEFDEPAPLECATHPWNNWSDCSTKCGRGKKYRVRTYKDPRLAESYNCQLALRQDTDCTGTKCGLSQGEDQATSTADGFATAECALTEWSSWSPCSKRCGKGLNTRRRSYVNLYATNKCQRGLTVQLEQTQKCVGKDCGGTIPTGFYDNNDLDPQLTQLKDLSPFEQQPAFRQNEHFDLNIGETNQYMPSSEQEDFGRRVDPPRGSIYGNEKLVEEEHTIRRQENTNFRDFQANEFATDEQLNTDVVQFNGQNRMRNQNNRFASQPHSTSADSSTSPRYDNGIRERYNEFGHKTITVDGGSPENYAVVQKYCFNKPFPTHHICRKSSVQVRNYWFYDADDRKCKIFTADACDENKNKFRTLRACEGTCLRPQQNQDGQEDDGSDETDVEGREIEEINHPYNSGRWETDQEYH